MKEGERRENGTVHRHNVRMEEASHEPNELMDTPKGWCPNVACPARGLIEAGTLRIHDCKRQRSRWKTCTQTDVERAARNVHKALDVIVGGVIVLTYGCPMQAVAHAYGLDERRTVAHGQDQAGQHCQRLHHAVVEQASLDLIHVQANAIRVRGQGMTVWVAGIVSWTRERELADRLLARVRRCAAAVRPLLVCPDGWAADPGRIRRACRENIKRTRGPGCCQASWLARSADRHGHHTHEEEACRLDHPAHDAWDA